MLKCWVETFPQCFFRKWRQVGHDKGFISLPLNWNLTFIHVSHSLGVDEELNEHAFFIGKFGKRVEDWGWRWRGYISSSFNGFTLLQVRLFKTQRHRRHSCWSSSRIWCGRRQSRTNGWFGGGGWIWWCPILKNALWCQLLSLRIRIG